MTELWPFRPELGCSETLDFSSEVLGSRTGEQRLSLRSAPRQKFSYSHRLLDEQQFARARGFVRRNGVTPVYVPVWGEQVRYGPIDASVSVLGFNTSTGDWRVGAQLVVWDDPENYVVCTIAAVTAGSISLTTIVGQSFSAAVVCPVRSALMTEGLSISRGKVHSDVSATFQVIDNVDMAASYVSAYPQYGGIDVMTDAPKLVTEVNESIIRSADPVDSGFGPVVIETQRNYSQYGQTVVFHDERPGLWKRRLWLHSLRGKQKIFWMPTFNRDLVLQDAVISSSTTLSVASIRPVNYYVDKHIMIECHDGGRYFRQITGAASAGGGIDNLTISASLGFTLSPADVNMISFLSVMRLDTDSVDIQHNYDLCSVVSIPVIEARDTISAAPAGPPGFMGIGNWRDDVHSYTRHIMPAMSVNGTDWTTDYPQAGGLYVAASNGSRVVAHGWDSNGFDGFWRSDDQGRSWTFAAAPQGPDGYDVGHLFDGCWTGTQFIFVGNDDINRPIAMTSPDGVTWATHFTDSNNDDDGAYYEADLDSVAYGNGKYVAVGVSFIDDDEAVLYSSPNAITWTRHVITTYPVRSYFEGVAWNGALFVAVGYDDDVGVGMVMTSPDGIIWTKCEMPGDLDGEFRNVACRDDGMCVAVGYRYAENTPCVAISYDGITWTATNPTMWEGHIPDVADCYSVAWNGSLWCAVGNQTVTFNFAFVMTSPDGITWTGSEIKGNQVDTFLGDVIATPVNPFVPDLSNRTDFLTLSVWIKGADDGNLCGGSFPRDTPTINVQSTANGQFMTDIRSADFTWLWTFGETNSSMGKLIDPLIWSHVLVSVDTNHPEDAKIAQLWVNDVDMIATNRTFLPFFDWGPAFQMKFHGKPFAINGSATVDSPTTPYAPYAQFDIAEAWFAPGQYIDFSVVANRRKFIDASGNPVSLGTNGSLPTGMAPAVYFSGNTASFPTNRGTGGPFTLTGTLTNASTSPAGVGAVHFVSGTSLLNPSLDAPT